ncbi:hypothetical protein [Streptomyces poonensis]|uniref:Lipoprotein n=1 Tax=Streptomyces poonensis TaxID=68255 RepID=A0A918PE85_9ACTN|nr:hypothetical protein [Streptomyces poonensis]GGZ02598.1 hypothetical protein GCM10010365_21670 [Streptomyces poonensis]GLJ93211.1 hypothetical protein GCM10017589_58230 [Streptomyces poonensis]
MRTRTSTTRPAPLFLALVLSAVGAGAVTACGTEQAGGTGGSESSPRRDARARQVAAAWDGSEAAEKWHEGYHPMGEVVQLPEGGLRSEADRRAYTTGNFDLRGDLPAAPRKDGKVTWKTGSSLTMPLRGAQEAYKTLDRADGMPGARLTVTGAELGVMSVATSRGPATVPAWLFALEGYDTPLRRAAAIPSKLPEPPVEPVPDGEVDGLTPLAGLVKVADDGRSVTVVATHGSCDDGPAVDVLESDGSVVLSASVAGRSDGVCTADLNSRKVTVTTEEPVGDRLVLDACTGRPVPYGDRLGTSESWS